MSKYEKQYNKNARRRYNKKYYGRTSNLYEPRPWSDDEIDMMINKTKTDSELSVILQRSVTAIQRKRWAIKKELEITKKITNIRKD